MYNPYVNIVKNIAGVFKLKMIDLVYYESEWYIMTVLLWMDLALLSIVRHSQYLIV